MLLLPMVAQDRALGLVQVTESRHQRTFGEQEVTIAQLLANQAAPAIHSAITQAETERRLDRQMILRRASTIISSTLDLRRCVEPARVSSMSKEPKPVRKRRHALAAEELPVVHTEHTFRGPR